MSNSSLLTSFTQLQDNKEKPLCSQRIKAQNTILLTSLGFSTIRETQIRLTQQIKSQFYQQQKDKISISRCTVGCIAGSMYSVNFPSQKKHTLTYIDQTMEK